jgi:hypothetical protein
MSTPQITAQQAARLSELRAKQSAHESACDAISPRKKNGWRIMTADESARVSAIAPFSNDERSELERLQFAAELPARYSAYFGERAVNTWTGDTLLAVTWTGRPFRSNFGDTRTPFRAVHASSGARYYGTSQGNGMLCRIRRAK